MWIACATVMIKALEVVVITGGNDDNRLQRCACVRGSSLGALSVGRGRRRSPAVACWASDHWGTSSNPLRGKFRH